MHGRGGGTADVGCGAVGGWGWADGTVATWGEWGVGLLLGVVVGGRGGCVAGGG